MGTKGSYTGAAGPVASDIRDGMDDWLASLPGADTGVAVADRPVDGQRPRRSLPSISPASVLPTIGLFRRSGGGGADGPGGGGATRGGPQRSAAASANAAGRGAAAAYAYRTGDADALRELGLSYDELRANPDIFDVANRIAQAVCDQLPAGTIEGDELLHVVGDLAGWVLEAGPEDVPPPPEEIAREALARVIAGAYLTERAARLNEAGLTRQERIATENQIRAVCDEIAAQATLSPTAPTSQEFTAAVEDGLASLRTIWEASL